VPSVREVLQNRELYFVEPQLSVADAARYMSERNVGAVCVLDGGRLVGVLSERDLMKRILAADRDSRRTSVAEVMTSKPLVVDVNQTHETCLKMMKQAGIRHLPVVEGDQLIGLISLRDILQVDLSEKDAELKLMQDYIYYVPPSKPRN
jgi:CBS domain-containing protein